MRGCPYVYPRRESVCSLPGNAAPYLASSLDTLSIGDIARNSRCVPQKRERGMWCSGTEKWSKIWAGTQSGLTTQRKKSWIADFALSLLFLHALPLLRGSLARELA